MKSERGGTPRKGLVLLGLVILSVILYAARWQLTETRTYGDTYHYLTVSLELIGESQSDARLMAATYICQTRHANTELSACENSYMAIPERYRDIFDSRILYPLVSSPFVAIFGGTGMTFASALLGVAWAVLFALVVRESGGSILTMVLALILVFALPIGGWATGKLAEGSVYLGLTGVALGALKAIRGKTRLGIITLAGSFAWLGLTKASSAVALGAAIFCLALLAAFVITDFDLRMRALWVSASGLVASSGIIGLLQLLGQPGLNETLQDLYTQHFSMPDVSDPVGRLLSELPVYIRAWSEALVSRPLILISFVVAMGLIYRLAYQGRVPAVAAVSIWLAVGLSGIPLILAHPVASEIPRLMAPAWMPVAAGFATALTLSDRSSDSRDDPI